MHGSNVTLRSPGRSCGQLPPNHHVVKDYRSQLSDQRGIISNIAYHDNALFALATADGRNIDNNIHVWIIHRINNKAIIRYAPVKATLSIVPPTNAGRL